jgi:hypothetical protein
MYPGNPTISEIQFFVVLRGMILLSTLVNPGDEWQEHLLRHAQQLLKNSILNLPFTSHHHLAQGVDICDRRLDLAQQGHGVSEEISHLVRPRSAWIYRQAGSFLLSPECQTARFLELVMLLVIAR